MGVLIADNIGLKGGQTSTIALWILKMPYKTKMKKECGKDAVKDEKLYYFGGWLKNLIFKGASQKNNIEGALAKKRGLGQFADLTRGEGGGGGGRDLARKRGGVFQGRDWYPKAHYGISIHLTMINEMWTEGNEMKHE